MKHINDFNIKSKKDSGSNKQTMTSLLNNITDGSIYLTTTELISDTISGKYGIIFIIKYNSNRASSICLCTDGALYVNSWNTSISKVTGWIEK